MKETRILAISPGSREIGVAVLDGSDLLYYAVKIIGARSQVEDACRAASRITYQLVEAYQPDTLALLRPLVIQSGGERLVAVIREVKRATERQGVMVHEYAPKTVRQFICGSKRATRQGAVRVLTSRYPELAQYAEGRGIWEELYYARMFGAVAVGLTCHYDAAT